MFFQCILNKLHSHACRICYKEELHMYFNGTHLKKIQDEYYGSLPLGRIDHMACALHMICRLIGNSPIKIYVNYSGWVMIDENSVEENRPKRGERGSTSIIRIDRSSSVKDYEGQERSFRERNDSYEKEVELIQKLSEFPAVVAQAGTDYSPSTIANYVYELVKAFNQFYHDFSILNADTTEARSFRLVLAANVAKVIRIGMGLLGIDVPERM